MRRYNENVRRGLRIQGLADYVPAEKKSIVIVGGGPAGSSAAYHLAMQDIPVVLLEKGVLNQKKCCAGGISLRSLRALDEMQSIDKYLIKGVQLFVDEEKVEYRQKSAMGYTVERPLFDQWLRHKAALAGADIRYGYLVDKIIPQDTKIIIHAQGPDGTVRLHAKIMLGAFGVQPNLFRELNHQGPPLLLKALQVEYKINKTLDDTLFGHTVSFFFGQKYSPLGYGWIFPRFNVISVGVSLPVRQKQPRRNLQQVIDHPCLQQLFRDGFLEASPIHRCSALIPIHPVRTPIGRRYLLLGDAAGYVDPLTQEGVAYAMLSGKIAAQSIIEHRGYTDSGLQVALKKYYQQCKQVFYREFRMGRLLQSTLYHRNASRQWKILVDLIKRSPNLLESIRSGKVDMGNMSQMFHRLSLS
ncbi:MAG: geranylgeranyl reductase family protein, partial [Candidatus Ranarchaeia archaeon]